MSADVFVNGRFSRRKITGAERFAGEITKRFCSPDQVIVPAKPVRGPAGHFWEQVVLPDRLPRGALLWSPANTGPLRVRNQAITILDLAPLEHPEWYRSAFRVWYRLLLPTLARNSRSVITVSEFTRQRLVDMLKIDPGRIVVIPGGVDHSFFYPKDPVEVQAVHKRYGIEGEYLLAVGTLQPRKNLPGLLKAWESIGNAYEDQSLVIAGEENSGIFQDISNGKPLERVIWLGYVPDRDLAALYSGALALVYPSFYEGFGLPLLEAMACGTTVLTSSAGAMPEVTGDAGLYFDPNSWEEIADCIRILLVDRGLREELASKGKKRASNFSWERSAELLARHLGSICYQ